MDGPGHARNHHCLRVRVEDGGWRGLRTGKHAHSPLLCLQAPGEAEAELAYLNRIGVIDAVLSDDVDTFLFGAKTVVRKYVLQRSAANSHPNPLVALMPRYRGTAHIH